MKRHFSQVIGAGALAVSLAVLPFTIPVQAQTNNDTGASTVNPNTRVYNDNASENRNFDWGWLGLLGLLGLAGLAGKKNDEPTRYRDPNAVGSSSYRE
jgi:hypothetical protein